MLAGDTVLDDLLSELLSRSLSSSAVHETVIFTYRTPLHWIVKLYIQCIIQGTTNNSFYVRCSFFGANVNKTAELVLKFSSFVAY